MSDPEFQRQSGSLDGWDWRAALAAHPIGRYGGLAWLADTVGPSRRTVYAYSSGTRRVPTAWLQDVARALGHEGSEDGDRHNAGR